MTGSTHIAIGIVSSLAILQPKTIPQCLCAATGGMIGGMISDIDHPKKRESIHYSDDHYGWQIYTFFGIAITVLLALDFFEGNGAVDFFISKFWPFFVGQCCCFPRPMLLWRFNLSSYVYPFNCGRCAIYAINLVLLPTVGYSFCHRLFFAPCYRFFEQTQMSVFLATKSPSWSK